MTKQDATEFMKKDHAVLEDVINGLSQEQIENIKVGDWSIKDILAHLVEWRKEFVEDIDYIAKGEVPPRIGTISTEDYNDRAVAKYAGLKYDEVYKMWPLHNEPRLGGFEFWLSVHKQRMIRKDHSLFMSGRRDSNSRPSPWKGDVLAS